ncbi:MAG: hypothetical protein V3V14_11165 [Saprospiraceae bacterium]
MIKKSLLDILIADLELKIQVFQTNIKSIIDSKNNETKSSAGDKFETGRAMMQIEQENKEIQLSKAINTFSFLKQLDINHNSESVRLGSLVYCDTGVFFISAALGKVYFDKKPYFALSLDAPLGRLLFGCKVNDKVTLNHKVTTILEID